MARKRRGAGATLIAADGGSSGLRGLAAIGEAHHQTDNFFVAAFFHADRRRYSSGRDGALLWMLAPAVEGNLCRHLSCRCCWSSTLPMPNIRCHRTVRVIGVLTAVLRKSSSDRNRQDSTRQPPASRWSTVACTPNGSGVRPRTQSSMRSTSTSTKTAFARSESVGKYAL